MVKYNAEETDDAMFIRCERIIKHLDRWGHSLSKDITKQRMKHSMVSERQVKEADDPIKFCNSDSLKKAVNDILNSGSSRILSEDHTLVISFLAANLIYPNAQRPGVVKNMKIAEFIDRERISTEKVLIKVFEHKTIAARGPANVVISTYIDNLMETYYRDIRMNMVSQRQNIEDRFFLTFTGNEFRKVAESIQKTAKKFKLPMPSPCLHHKVIATAGRYNLDDTEMRSLTSHMAHSMSTSARFYQFPSAEPSRIAATYDTIQNLVKARTEQNKFK